MPAQPLRAVLFDKDGTLVDFDATWRPILFRLANEAARGDPEKRDGLLALGGYDRETGRFRGGSVLAAGNTRDLVRTFAPDRSAGEQALMIAAVDRMFTAHGATGTVTLPGVATCLDRLRAAGLAIGLATSDSTAAAEAALGCMGVRDRFDAVLGYDAVTRPKPHGDIALAFCERVGVPPGAVAMVGDNPHDIETARAAGLRLAIGITTGNSERAALAATADHVVQSLDELTLFLLDDCG